MNDGEDATLPDSNPGEPAAARTDGSLGDRYQLKDVIGRGGMGEVRLARDSRIDRDVAIKLLRSAARDDATLGRFWREARVQGVLDHPAVVPVHDLGVDDAGNPYFVMKRLAGTTLADVLASTDPAVTARWPRRQLLARLVDVCLAIEFSHQRGVIHRDLKPANLMLGDYGEAYVLDWGLARIAEDRDSYQRIEPLSGDDLGHTAAGDLLGTPGYMSPEQARGESVDWRTDVYALGCVLYEILVGSPALPRGLAAIAATLTTPCHRPSERGTDVAPELDDLCARATAQAARDRPTARALADGIQAYLDGDRDIERRRELAIDHARAARAALTATGDDARATAMREAGRALALDPENTTAQTVLAHLLLELPDSIPAEAMVSADAERGDIRQRVIRKAVWAYLAAIPVLAILFLLPVRSTWPIVFGMAAAATTAVLAVGLGRRPMPMRSHWFLVFTIANCTTIGTTGLLFGPVLILPFFLIGSLSAFVTQPSRYHAVVIAALHLVPLGVILGLELGGVLPRSFAVEHGVLIIKPWAIELTSTSLFVVFGLAFAVQLGSTIDVQSSFRRAQEQSQDLLHARAWHLRQLLPDAGTLST